MKSSIDLYWMRSDQINKLSISFNEFFSFVWLFEEIVSDGICHNDRYSNKIVVETKIPPHDYCEFEFQNLIDPCKSYVMSEWIGIKIEDSCDWLLIDFRWNMINKCYNIIIQHFHSDITWHSLFTTICIHDLLSKEAVASAGFFHAFSR